MVVGVGRYRHLLGGDPEKLLDEPLGLEQLTSPPVSAEALADWLVQRQCDAARGVGFNNPAAPLASVEMLLSPAQTYRRSDGTEVAVEEASRTTSSTATTAGWSGSGFIPRTSVSSISAATG